MGLFAQRMGSAVQALLSDWETAVARVDEVEVGVVDIAEAAAEIAANPGTIAPGSVATAVIAAVAVGRMGCMTGHNSVVAEVAAVAGTAPAGPVIRRGCKSLPAVAVRHS